MSAEAPERLETQVQGGFVVPAFEGGPVAGGDVPNLPAGPEVLNLVRELVPTDRQRRDSTSDPESTTDLTSITQQIKVAEAALAETEPSHSRRARMFQTLTDADPRKIEGPRLPLVVFGLSGLLGGIDLTLLNLAYPEIQSDFGLSIVGLANIGAVVGVLGYVVGLPLGYLVDRVRKRVWLLRFGEVAGIVGTLVQALAPGSGVFLAGNVVEMVGSLPSERASYPLLVDSYPSRQRARAVGFLTLVSVAGSLIGAPIAGVALTLYGWREASLILAVFPLLIVVLSFFFREPVRGALDRLEMGATAESAALAQPTPSFQESLRAAWSIRTLRLQAIAGFVSQLFMGPVQLLVALTLASRFGLNAAQRGLLAGAGSGVALIALPLAAAFGDRLLARRPGTLVSVQAGLTLVSTFLLLAEAVIPSLSLFIVTALFASVLNIVAAPIELTVISLVTPARIRGVGFSISAPFLLISVALGPQVIKAAGGLTPQQTLSFFAPFLLLGGLIQLASGSTVARDIRAARAASLAQDAAEKSQGDGQHKILVCRDVDVSYGDVQVLFNVDFDVAQGEIVALVGTNGAGKSTLLRAICGLSLAGNGAIFYEGRDITSAPTHENAQAGVIYMPGGQGVFPQLTVAENLQTAGWTNRKDPAAVEAATERVLTMFPRLRERLATVAGALSGGEQQMLAVGQVFLMRPRLLMIDELSLGLAPAIVELLLDAVRAMRDEGVTVILVEQSLNVALTIADRAVFMEKGEIRFDGATDDLLARPDLVRAVFMGGGGGGASVASRQRLAGPDDEAAPALRAQGIDVRFGGLAALSDIDLAVTAGEVVGIIGPNGAGKTTLFDVLSGYTRQSAGEIFLGDREIGRLTPDARARLGLGRAFQNAKLFPPLTVRENICVALEARTVKSALLGALWAPQVRTAERKLMSRVDGYIELLGLTAYAEKFVRELSTGTRRAVEVACQMAAEPKVLLLDEPSSGLAQAETEQLGPALLRIVKETGCGMIVIEHDLPLITGISDRLVAMELGRVIAVGTPQEVTHDPRVLASYLAASDDVIERSGSRTSTVRSAVAEALNTD